MSDSTINVSDTNNETNDQISEKTEFASQETNQIESESLSQEEVNIFYQ